eukprot:g4174.t1
MHSVISTFLFFLALASFSSVTNAMFGKQTCFSFKCNRPEYIDAITSALRQAHDNSHHPRGQGLRHRNPGKRTGAALSIFNMQSFPTCPSTNPCVQHGCKGLCWCTAGSKNGICLLADPTAQVETMRRSQSPEKLQGVQLKGQLEKHLFNMKPDHPDFFTMEDSNVEMLRSDAIGTICTEAYDLNVPKSVTISAGMQASDAFETTVNFGKMECSRVSSTFDNAAYHSTADDLGCFCTIYPKQPKPVSTQTALLNAKKHQLFCPECQEEGYINAHMQNKIANGDKCSCPGCPIGCTGCSIDEETGKCTNPLHGKGCPFNCCAGKDKECTNPCCEYPCGCDCAKCVDSKCTGTNCKPGSCEHSGEEGHDPNCCGCCEVNDDGCCKTENGKLCGCPCEACLESRCNGEDCEPGSCENAGIEGHDPKCCGCCKPAKLCCQDKDGNPKKCEACKESDQCIKSECVYGACEFIGVIPGHPTSCCGCCDASNDEESFNMKAFQGMTVQKKRSLSRRIAKTHKASDGNGAGLFGGSFKSSSANAEVDPTFREEGKERRYRHQDASLIQQARHQKLLKALNAKRAEELKALYLRQGGEASDANKYLQSVMGRDNPKGAIRTKTKRDKRTVTGKAGTLVGTSVVNKEESM